MELMKLGELRAYHEEDIVEVVKILKDNGFSVVDKDIESEYKRFHIMKDNEHEKYSNKPIKRTWSEWSDYHILHLTDLLGIPRNLSWQYRYNGKKIQVRSGTFKVETTCYKDDTFNLNKGLNLAKKRLIVKYLDNQVKLIAKAM